MALVAVALSLALASAASLRVARAADEAPATALDAQAELEAARARIDALEAENAALRAENERFRQRILGLQDELVLLTEDTLARESQWLDFTRVVASLSGDRLSAQELARVLGGPPRAEEPGAPEPEGGPLEALLLEAAGEAVAAPAAGLAQARRERSEEVARTLRSLFVAEQVDGLELLEAGVLADGATGPVVLRQADAWGRPVGTLAADRLRLEASRSGRTLTLVLEEGAERRGGERRAFEGAGEGAERGGARRIVLAGVDPSPWIEAMPELFELEARVEVGDDGRWNLTLVQVALNELLREDAAGGYFRLAAFAGVVDGELRDVQLEEYGRDGELARRLFADRLRVDRQERGLLVQLQDGVQMRGSRRLAFLDGRYRIFLPRADADEWTAIGLPGLVPHKDSPLAQGSQAPLPARLGASAAR